MKYYRTMCLGLLSGCLIAAGCSQKREESNIESANSDKSTESTGTNAEGIESYFPAGTASDSCSQGIVNLSSLWRTDTDLSVYANQEDGSPQTEQKTGVLKKDAEFRVTRVATFPVGDSDPDRVYGQLADGQGWTVLYNRQEEDSLATLKEGSKWAQNIPTKLRAESRLLVKPDGSPVKEKTTTDQILTNLETGADDTIWAKTDDGYYRLYSEDGSGFFTPIDGVVEGQPNEDTSLSQIYAAQLLQGTFQNFNKELCWGYVLCDLDGTGHPELLIINGGLESDQTVGVYGATDQLLSHKADGTFTAFNSLLYQDAQPGLLRFTNRNDQKTVTRISMENGKLKEKELDSGEVSKLDLQKLNKVTFGNINDQKGLEAVKNLTLGEVFPNHDFSGNGNAESKPDVKEMEPSSRIWGLQYDMVIRSDHDRKSGKLGTMPEGSQITITREYDNGSETWGLLEQGGWICLKDADMVYAIPADEKSPVNESPVEDSWRQIYRETLTTIASDPKYDSYSDYDPSWYLWSDSGYNVPMLVVKTGICKADYKLEFYIASDGEAQKVAETSAGHATFYSTGMTGQFDRLMAHMGVEAIDRLTLSNGNLSSEQISYRTDVLDYQTPAGTQWDFLPIHAFR